MRLRLFLAAVAASASSTVLADSLDINLKNDAAQAIYATNWRTAEVNTGLLYNNDHHDWVASVGLLSSGQKETSQTRTEAGLGGKIYGASVSHKDVVALGLGGQFRVFPNDGPIGFSGYGYYAPNIVTFVDGQRFWEIGARVEFEIVKNTANIYLGYRKVRADLDNDTHATVDSGANVGVKISF
jgi:hypothetical protein